MNHYSVIILLTTAALLLLQCSKKAYEKNLGKRNQKCFFDFNRYILSNVISLITVLLSFTTAQEYTIIRTNALVHRQVEIVDIDSMKVSCRYAEHQFSIPLDSMSQIHNEEYGGYGPFLATVGIFVGGAVGYYIAPQSKNRSFGAGIENTGSKAFMLGLGMGVGALSGAIIGNKLSKPKRYQLAGLSRAEKYALLQKLTGRQ